jgi:hypothetical protein
MDKIKLKLTFKNYDDLIDFVEYYAKETGVAYEYNPVAGIEVETEVMEVLTTLRYVWDRQYRS